VIRHLCQKLELPEPNRIRDQLIVPSIVKAKSNTETRQLLGAREADMRPRLVDKWRNQVDEREEARAMKILEVFELDIYRPGDVLPARWAWIGPGPDRDAGSPHASRQDSMNRHQGT
jgi:hypothetical protein